MKIKQLRILYLIHLMFHYLPLGLYFPVSTLFLLSKGYSLSWIGVALAIYSGTILFLEIPTGGLADKVGRVILYRISRIFSIISLLILFFSHNLFMLFFAMLLNGVSRALSSGSMDAWFVDMHEDQADLQKSMVLTAGIAPAFLGIFTLFGGFIPDYIAKIDSLNNFGKYDFNILLGIFTILIHFIFHTICFKRDITQNDSGNLVDFSKGLFDVIKKSHNLKFLFAVSFMLGIGLISVESFWQPWVKTIAPESPSFYLGILSSIYFFAATIGSLFSLKLTNIFGEKNTLIIMKIFHGIALCYLGFWSGLFQFSIGFASVFVFHGALSAPHQTLLHKSVDSSYRASLLSLDSFAIMGGVSIASAIFGWIAQNHSIPVVWIFSGACIMISSLFYIPIKIKKD